MNSAVKHTSFKTILKRILYFFPFQLVLVHIKKNHIMLLFWYILFGFVTNIIGKKFGISYLFLSPEYLDQVGFRSHFILGFSVGGFITAFNISSYITNGFRFPFIATLSRPFFKYSINNFIIPLSFIIVYTYRLIDFQYSVEEMSYWHIVKNLLGFYTGMLFFLIFAYSYFFSTNIHIGKIQLLSVHKKKPTSGILYKPHAWFDEKNKDWRIKTYLNHFFSIKLTRDISHYNDETLEKIFRQNHLNASLFEIIILLSVFVIGIFRDYEVFRIPASASAILILTMLSMLASAIHSWVKGWSTTVFILIILLINFLSKSTSFNYMSYAYGLNYEENKADYTYANIDSLKRSKYLNRLDFKNHINILNNWRLKNILIEKNRKPKLVIINTSGGGLRSALWTFRVLQYVDSVLQGKLWPQIHLITGASGGMIGAAYFREVFYRAQRDSTIQPYAKKHLINISKDLLNPVMFTMAVNDLFIRHQVKKQGKKKYTKDRGYAFEMELMENTDNYLKKKLYEYRKPEEQAQIPLMVLSPTITNDGRRLIISSTTATHLVNSAPIKKVNFDDLPEAIEFRAFFRQQDADSLWFTSALRMNATFPYIMPTSSLPSSPEIQVMDAGIRDNYGLVLTYKHLFAFRNWIKTNTSGVIIIQLRDKPKRFPIKDNPLNSLFKSLANPLGSFYGNWSNIQNFDQDDLLHYAGAWLDVPVDVILFELQNTEENSISLSWHLTSKEKKKIITSIYDSIYQDDIAKLKMLLNY